MLVPILPLLIEYYCRSASQVMQKFFYYLKFNIVTEHLNVVTELDWHPEPSASAWVPGEIHTFEHRTAGPHEGFAGQTRTEAAGQTVAQCLPHVICLLERSAGFRHVPVGRKKAHWLVIYVTDHPKNGLNGAPMTHRTP